jgi:Sugar (and other) transporter
MSPLVVFEMAEITETLQLEALIDSQSSYVDLFKTAANRRRALITGIIGFYGAWTGNAVISYYLSVILDTIGIKDTPHQAL